MIYLNSEHISLDKVVWNDLFNSIDACVDCVACSDFAQPVKPYLRYHNMKNRMIAMPAFVGGDVFQAGIKWIASFPGNISRNMPRAHSVTILNDPETGVPVAIINTSAISVLRTAAVTGWLVNKFMKIGRFDRNVKIGIVGLGPIGNIHLKMLTKMFSPHQINKLSVFDNNSSLEVKRDDSLEIQPHICKSWEQCFEDADIFVTATTSDHRYINRVPKKGALHLNVSLRDYTPSFFKHVDVIVVDDWKEVCRENTDIEIMNKYYGLEMDSCYSIIDFRHDDLLQSFSESDVIMFNPMGMAAFDIAIASYYYRKATEQKIGIELI